MKLLSHYFYIIILAPGIFFGCAFMQATEPRKTAAPAPPQVSASSQPTTSQSYLTKASTYETRGDLRLALFYLKIAVDVSPQNKQISKRVVDLQQRIDANAEIQFKAGVQHYRDQQFEKARQAFLKTLLCNPQHPEALIYLKTRISPFKFLAYAAQKGEKKTDIAEKIYQDSGKAFLISYFVEETGNREILKQGIRMELPYLESVPVKQKAKTAQQPADTAPTYQLEKSASPAFNIQTEIAKADGFLKNKQYDDVLTIADKIIEHDNFSKEAEGLINKVYYQKGNDLFEEKRYLEARTYFSFIDPEYIPTEKIQATIKDILDKQAESHYLEGVNYFINEDLKNAIVAWETVLKLNPDHEKAKTDIQNAKHLLEKLQDLE